MRNASLISFVLVLFLIGITSCEKTVTETIIQKETDTLTITVTVRDTLYVRSVDTVIDTKAFNWTAYSYENNQLVDSGTNTYSTTAEGIKVVGQAYRLGLRLQTKAEYGIVNKHVYLKWKVVSGGLFSAVVPQLKYDIADNDGLPDIQGVDWDFFSTTNTWNGSTLINPNEWYFTRLSPIPGTDGYSAVTARGNYNHLGGTVVSTKSFPIYTKSGYIAIRLSDQYAGTSAYLVLAECRINKN